MSFASKDVSSCYYREMARGFILSVLMMLLGAPAVGRACSVPVFRYALERWAADRFSAVLFTDGKLSDAQDEVYTNIVRAADAPAAGLNLDVQKVDVKEIPGKYGRLWKEQEAFAAGKLPWLVIHYPVAVGDEQKVMWAGPLESADVVSLLNSPVREELGKRLMKGQALVFVLLESGQKVRDERAAKLIEERIPILEKTVKVSKVLEDDPLVEGPALKSKLPVRLEMSVLRVSRDDPREKMLVRMLEGSQSETIDAQMPAVFPIFGRGRILCSFSGGGITVENLEDAAAFLAGPCSCQVKELNPGIDLLMAADWDSIIEDREAVAPRIARIQIPQPKIAAGAATKPASTVASTQSFLGSYSVSHNPNGTVAFSFLMDERGMLKVAIGLTTVVVVVLGLVLLRQRVGR
jgi:hypothetical protein